MESWKRCFHEGIVPHLSDAGLEALRVGLLRDDQCLIQGGTTTPPPLACVQDWPVEGACAMAYCGWQGEGLETVAEVEEYFAKLCCQTDESLDELAGCRWFINWFDETPREEMRAKLLIEVGVALAGRRAAVA